MRLIILCSICMSRRPGGPRTFAQDNSTPPIVPKATAVDQAPDGTASNTVLRTNSMSVLDDKKRLGTDDFVSFRVVEDRDNLSQRLRVNDNGELEVPYIGLVPAQGKTCRELAYNIKAALEKEYYYHATVILAVDKVSEKSRGKIYVYGAVKYRARRKFQPMRPIPSVKRSSGLAASAILPTSARSSSHAKMARTWSST